jgi:prepilin-type N-terminal cleavage/methylation domain-containing protein
MKVRVNKGFTLIELLVVIAIIGILSGVVLTSLSTARNKAKDARIQTNLAQVRSLAEMIYADTTSYATLCNAGALNTANATYGTQITTINTDVTTQGGTNVACYGDASNYCVSASLNTGIRCVSSSGQTGSVACVAANTACQ